jgi:phosphoglycerate dehydrogenase-like enzyme
MPMSPTTRGLVGREDIALMKLDAVIINTSRAPIIDQAAVIEALQQKRIGGMGVDVYESEPLAQDHPYRHLVNVVATPHIGYVTEENYRLFFGQSLENLEAFLKGAPLRVIN